MNPNKKHCDGCGKQLPIWKNVVVDGIRNRLCKHCWSCHKSNDSNSKPTKNKKPIAPRSHKRSQEERVYTGKRVIFMLEHPMCQANISGLCTHRSTDVHHKAGRVGSLLLDEQLWMSVCRVCHQWIEEHPIEATEQGWRVSKTI
jgi:hypothetical protein